ncbi:ATP-binding cassette domain-containing protein [Ammoniphilus sp. CFH 90114]|uniref:ATP-binding cassette domain-containing protein n=1 Tax=Ammoniphilus sp. CFH 90114 TaxID=2493665 RepID=UPI00100F21B9|nr:ABC transporter ATP-binding protein [Ammoniphilus sp. CFH 90114]RXT07158.1 ABC transporter ATP-binding protein [Ammoniphilus sp. CFH 90114]
METSALTITGLTKKLKNFSLGPLDLIVEKGTIVALIGANGSGKSTFLRVLMNVLKADSGTIYAFGENFSENETALKQKIGYVGDKLEPYRHLSIKELSSLISYWYPTWDHQRYLHYLSRYQIDENMKYEHGSTGTRKKVEFIFSLCYDSQLLVLDEPSAGMDMVSQRKMKEDLLNYMEDGERSILIATHIADEVEQLSDYIAVIEEGKIVLTFNKDDVREHWARVSVSQVTDSLLDHAHVISTSMNPPEIVTNHLSALEMELKNQQITINQIQRLTLEEVVENLTT